MTEQGERWRVDPYGRGLWRVVAITEGTPIVVNCGYNRALAERLVADHTAAARAEATEAALREWLQQQAKDWRHTEGYRRAMSETLAFVTALTPPALQSDTGTVD